jgi:hypothetical protein
VVEYCHAPDPDPATHIAWSSAFVAHDWPNAQQKVP